MGGKAELLGSCIVFVKLKKKSNRKEISMKIMVSLDSWCLKAAKWAYRKEEAMLRKLMYKPQASIILDLWSNYMLKVQFIESIFSASVGFFDSISSTSYESKESYS